MIEDSKRHQFEVVLVYKLDRFARNRYDSSIYKTKLKRNGVKVLSAKENITDTPEGIILEGLIEAMNEYYSAELSQKIKRGMRENIIKGKATGGNVALGYTINVDKKIVINEQEAQTVRNIFKMYAEGYTYQQIQDELNRQGRKTSRGNDFNKSSMNRILSNRRYIGEYTCKNVPEVMKCPELAIIDIETFNRVQSRLETWKTHHKKKSENANYILTSKAICGYCGKNLKGYTGTSKTKAMHYYYTCKSKCEDSHTWKKTQLEDLVISAILEYLTGDRISKIAKKVSKIYNKNSDTKEKLKQLDIDYKKVCTSISNIMRAIEQGIITSTTKSRLQELEQQKEDIEVATAHLKITMPKFEQSHFEYTLKKLTKENLLSDESKLRLIETIVNRVVVYNDKIVVIFNFTDQFHNDDELSLDKIEKTIEECSSIVSCGGGDEN